jgi:hypothetical protein
MSTNQMSDKDLSARIYKLNKLVAAGEKVINGFNAAESFGWTETRAKNLKEAVEARFKLGEFAEGEQASYEHVLAACEQHL